MAGLAIGIAGLVMSAGGMAMNIANASKQKKLIGQAEAAGEAALLKAKKVIEVNYMEGLPVPKEVYELERENILTAGAQATAAAVEGSQRGVQSTVGMVNAAQGKASRKVAASQEQLITENIRRAAEQDVVLQNQRLGIELGGVQGAQQAVADATRSQQQSIAQAAQQAGQIGMGILGNEDINPLYGRGGTTTLPNGQVMRNRTIGKMNDAGAGTIIDQQIGSGGGLQNSFQQPMNNTLNPLLINPATNFQSMSSQFSPDLFSIPGVTSTGVA